MKTQPKSFDEIDLHCPLMRFYTETCAAMGRIVTVIPDGTVQLGHSDKDGQPAVTFQFLDPGHEPESDALSITLTMAEWNDKAKDNLHGVADAIAGIFWETYQASLPATTPNDVLDPRD